MEGLRTIARYFFKSAARRQRPEEESVESMSTNHLQRISEDKRISGDIILIFKKAPRSGPSLS